MLFVLRHAQRADDKTVKEDVFIENEWDPPLTSYGINQAKFSGETIQAIVQKIRSDRHEVRVVTSPFLRCVQTAAKVAEALGESTVYLEDGFCECLFPYLFPRNPLNSLVIRTPNTRISNYLPANLKYEPATRLAPSYPEGNMLEVRKRVVQTFASYRSDMEQWENRGEGKMPIYIIVTHSYCLSVLTENIDHKNAKSSAILAPGYCALTYAYWMDSTWKTRLLCSDHHLKGNNLVLYIMFGLLLYAVNYLRLYIWQQPEVS